jgi:hypothetical protein
MQVQHRPQGSWFNVVLRSPEFSYGTIAVMGGVGGKAAVPRPEFGSRCVCCNRRNSAMRAFGADTDRTRVGAIAVPVCSDCDPHVTLNTLAPQFIGASLCVGAGLAVLGLSTDMVVSGWLGLAGGVVLALLVLWMVARRSSRRRSAALGHYTGLEIHCLAHQCNVRTNNPRLAKDLLENNRKHVFRTTQPI